MSLVDMNSLVPLSGLLLGLLSIRLWVERYKDAFPVGLYIFKGLWYTTIVAYEYILLSGKPWLPTYLGGQGSTSFWDAVDDSSLTLLYQASLAYHAHSCVAAVMTGAKPEMHFHHLVTLALIFISDFLGYRRVGAVVMLLHDAPDVFSALIKGSIAAKNVPMTIVSYGALLVAWGYYRLYLFALLILSVLRVESPDEQWHVTHPEWHRYTFASLLSMLMLLHYYWYSQFFFMLCKYARSGKVKDTSETATHYGGQRDDEKTA